MVIVPQSVFVLCRDGGYEGYSPPLQAYSTLEEARAGKLLIAAAGEYCIDIFEVPLWPNAQTVAWYKIDKVPDTPKLQEAA